VAMIQTLKAMVERKDVLLSALSVFIKVQEDLIVNHVKFRDYLLNH